MIFGTLTWTIELYMTKYIIGEIFSSGGATLYKNPYDQNVKNNQNSLRTPTEFFMSATADLNSRKWNSGAYTKGKLNSPEILPACLQNSSMFSSLVKWAACILPVAIPKKLLEIVFFIPRSD